MTDFEQKLIEITEILIKIYDPCKIKNGSCLVGNPVPCCLNPYFDISKPCPFIGKECKKNRKLDCRIWFCKTALKNMSERCKKSFYALEEIAKLHGLIQKPYLGERYLGIDNER